MAYLLGYLYADGSLTDAPYMRGKYTSVTSTDRIMLERMREWMGSEHTITPLRHDVKYPGKPRYTLRIGSHKIFDDLTRLGLYPNKSLTIPFPNVPSSYLAHFIRGYLDGDGCIYLEMGTGKRGQRILKRLSTIFTSGSRNFLCGLEEVVRARLELQKRKISVSHRSFQLRYSTHDSIILCTFLYRRVPHHLYLERKRAVMRRYLRMRNGAVVK